MKMIQKRRQEAHSVKGKEGVGRKRDEKVQSKSHTWGDAGKAGQMGRHRLHIKGCDCAGSVK